MATVSTLLGSRHASLASVTRRQDGPVGGGTLVPAAGSSGEDVIVVASDDAALSAVSSNEAAAMIAASPSAGAGVGDIGGAVSLPSTGGRVESPMWPVGGYRKARSHSGHTLKGSS